nr:immunoglobulin heavy chain junction region [Macaca mulatta]MOW87264.1 immunoglobulin heavy chain junction region [Macaca mulatta]MOW87280.1 immunoglobulin heavy chain junction region [Macaca mulatta]MOW87372.1 immunoglobulin heavy chain junction region [Macaca mulatta]MOW87577.1 immunoglobulin heavy chain junction region [Macaca mulatta]
CTTMVYW